MSTVAEEPQKKAPSIKASRGLLISCDGALKQFLLRLNENSPHKLYVLLIIIFNIYIIDYTQCNA